MQQETVNHLKKGKERRKEGKKERRKEGKRERGKGRYTSHEWHNKIRMRAKTSTLSILCV